MDATSQGATIFENNLSKPSNSTINPEKQTD